VQSDDDEEQKSDQEQPVLPAPLAPPVLCRLILLLGRVWGAPAPAGPLPTTSSGGAAPRSTGSAAPGRGEPPSGDVQRPQVWQQPPVDGLHVGLHSDPMAAQQQLRLAGQQQQQLLQRALVATVEEFSIDEGSDSDG